MRSLPQLFQNNRAWAEQMTQNDPQFFRKLARQQTPEYLWIGCSDSRVPANEIVGLLPGELFVHRNVANLVLHTDLNCLSVLQYAVDVLQVKHVIVCGHYGCGGVRAAMEDASVGLVDNWLRPIREVWHRCQEEMLLLNDGERADRLCELNVMAQVANVGHTTIVQNAWRRGQSLMIHGWIYGIEDGLLKDLGICVGAAEELESVTWQRMVR
ncbi:MAG: carbonate dehydratase [Armatimonadota bacterium]